jgi:hypothetical protein
LWTYSDEDSEDEGEEEQKKFGGKQEERREERRGREKGRGGGRKKRSQEKFGGAGRDREKGGKRRDKEKEEWSPNFRRGWPSLKKKGTCRVITNFLDPEGWIEKKMKTPGILENHFQIPEDDSVLSRKLIRE